MPVINVKKDGVWQDIASTYKHAHTVSDITDLPASFADDIESLKDKVGADSVAYQINTAIQANEYVHPFTHPADMITGLSDVAISGDYNDLSNLPEIPEEYVHPENHDVSMITGLATVATSGSYNDLSDKPTIPSIAGLATKTYVDEQIASVGGNGGSGGILEQVQADWDETDTTSPAYIKNKPTITGGGASVQANWNQNDESAADFIKNKPFGECGGLVDIMPLTTVEGFSYNSNYRAYSVAFTDSYSLIAEETYIVSWDGTDYECIAQDASALMQGVVIIGNASRLKLSGNNEPFVIAGIKGMGTEYIALTDTESGGSHTVRIAQKKIVIKKLDTKYFPEHLQFGENGGTEILNTSFVADLESGQNFIEDPSDATILIGETYTVAWNGVEYQCECLEAEGLLFVGNTIVLGVEDNGMPFAIIRDNMGLIIGAPGWFVISIVEPPSDITLSISSDGIKYLDNKYLDFITLQPAQEIMPEQNMTFTLKRENTNNPEESVFETKIDITSEFVAGNKYTVLLDGVEYNCTAKLYEGVLLYLGNLNLVNPQFAYTGEPFFISIMDSSTDSGFTLLTHHTSNDESFECSVGITTVPKYVIKNEFIPDDIGGGSSLPEVTTDDNDKVMTVVDGVWTAQTPASGLPEVTSSDNGKALLVSGGAWTVAEPAKGVPDVTTSDNGKVLKVVNGVWSATTVLPTVTSSDAGKFLRVGSNGTWVVEAMQDVSEVGA